MSRLSSYLLQHLMPIKPRVLACQIAGRCWKDSFLCKSEARCEVVFWERKLAGKNLRHRVIVHRCKRQPWLERSHDAIVWLKKSPATAFTVTYPPTTLDLQWNYQLRWTGIHQFQQNITINREMKQQWWSYQPGYLKWRNDESPGACILLKWLSDCIC